MDDAKEETTGIQPIPQETPAESPGALVDLQGETPIAEKSDAEDPGKVATLVQDAPAKKAPSPPANQSRAALPAAATVVLAVIVFGLCRQSPDAYLMKRLGITFMLLVVILGFSTATALAVISLVRRYLPWLAPLVMLVAKAAALFPVAALAWVFVGLWIGKFGMPIETLMPHGALMESIPIHERLALWIWQWVPVMGLVALPVIGELTVHLLHHWNRDPLHALSLGLRARGIKQSTVHYRHRLHALRSALLLKVLWLGWVSLLWMVPAEGILGVQGWGAAMAHSFEAFRDARQWLTVAGAGLCIGLAWTILWWLCWQKLSDPASPRRTLWRTTTPREAAVILGHSPFQAWLTHESRDWLQQASAHLLAFGSWAILLATWFTGLVNVWPGTLINLAGTRTLMNPQASLIPGTFAMLCALCFWILSRILTRAPTNDLPHGKR